MQLWLRSLLEDNKDFNVTHEDLQVNTNQEIINTTEQFNVENDHDYKMSIAPQGIEASQNIQSPNQDRNISSRLEPEVLSIGVATGLLSFLKTDAKANKKGVWDSKTPLDIINILCRYEKLKLVRRIYLAKKKKGMGKASTNKQYSQDRRYNGTRIMVCAARS